MIESSAPSRLEAHTLTSATPKMAEEHAAPSDASQNLKLGNAEEKAPEIEQRTDSCMGQNGGMDATHQNTVDSTSNLQSERSIGVAIQGDHSEPLTVEKVALSSTDGIEQVTTEHREHHTENTSAEEGEAATIFHDDSTNGFCDFKDVDEGALQSKGGADAPDDAESDDGFGGFEEADAGSTAESNRGDDDIEIKPEAPTSFESNIPPQVPPVSAASSSADIFTTDREEFLAQVRKLLYPSAVAASKQEGKENLPCINLDILIHQLAKCDASHVAVHAPVIGAEQAQYQEVTPITWEGSKAEMRFLSRFARSKVDLSARQQPSTGHHHAQAENVSKVDMLQASGAAVNGESLARSSGAERPPVENGDHAGIVGAAPTQASASAEVQVQPALDSSGFGAWATDPTLIPGILPSSNTDAGRDPDPSTPAANSAALAHLERRASPRSGSDRHAGTSPSRLRSSSLSRAEQSGGKQVERKLPDLSFMLSNTLVLPR